jgi:hypothetical protein
VTLSIYAQVMRRADRDELRAEIRGLLGAVAENGRETAPGSSPTRIVSANVRGIER